jgi:uncharacterized membrane protein (UPF0127 family)
MNQHVYHVKKLVLRRDGLMLQTGLGKVKVADRFLSRLVGLLNRSSLDLDEGLLITPCAGIHTIGMRFTIDLVFIDKENKVLGVSESVPPNRFRRAPKGTYAVLELADGNVSQTGIHLDDRLIFD